MLNGSKVLIIAPHADDEILGCGGIISKYKDNCHIAIIVVSDRKGELKNIQMAQARSIQDKTNISYIFLGLKDESLDIVPISDIIQKIELFSNIFLPVVVFIPNIGDINNDHKVVHNACLIAFRKIQKNQPKKLIVYEVPSSTTQGEPFSPNLYIELDKKDVDEKIQLLSVYIDEIRPEPNPRNPRGIMIYSEFRGMECNKKYAESFKILYDIN